MLLVPETLLFWISFLMPTTCDYITQRRKPCDYDVRGKLCGCRFHGRWKRDAMFAALGGRNPGQRFRVTWQAPETRADPRLARAEPPPGQRAAQPEHRGAYDLAMLAATIISAIAALATYFV
jgi:hypothetical protein